MDKPRIVAVLGMHRSGTSLITRGLKTLSVDLGDNFLPTIADENEKGFWENRDINQLNERVLKAWGSGWYRLATEDNDTLLKDVLSQERRDATSLLQSKISRQKVFGFKDPRTAILIAFWQRVFEDVDANVSYVIAVRNPLEVAASLHRRNLFDTPYSIALWLKYMMAAIEGSAGQRRIFVSYSNLMNDPAVQLSRISDALDLPMPKPSSAEFIEFAGDFISPDLRHNRISDNEVGRYDLAPKLVSDLYSTLLDWCNAEPSANLTLPAELKDAWSIYQSQNRMLLSLGDQLWRKLMQKSARVKEIDQSLCDNQIKSERLETDILAKREEIARLQGDLDEAKSALSSKQDALTASLSENKVANEKIAHLQDELENAKSALSSKQDTLTASLSENKVANEKIAHLQDELESAKSALSSKQDTLTASLSENKVANEKIAHLQDELEQAKVRHSRMQTDLTSNLRAREREIANLKANLNASKKQLQLREHSVKEMIEAVYQRVSSEKTAELSAQIAQKDAAVEHYRTSLRLAEHDLHALHASTSWRLTKPVRFARRTWRRFVRRVSSPFR